MPTSLKLNKDQVEDLVGRLPDDPDHFHYLELLLALPYGVYVEVMERLHSGEITIGVLSQQLHEISSTSGMQDLVIGDYDANKVTDNITFSSSNGDKSLESLIISSSLQKKNSDGLESPIRLPIQVSDSQKREYLRRLLSDMQSFDATMLQCIILEGTRMNLLGGSHQLRVLLMRLVEAKKFLEEWKIQRQTLPSDMLIFRKWSDAQEKVNLLYRLIENQVMEELSSVTSK